MVAVIKTGSSIHRIFNYNEQKVKEGVARCIGAVNYPKDVSHLTLSNKINRLTKQAALNENVTRNSVHISLNFDPSEKHSEDRLLQIAETYMHKIGFGKQPYLIYEHHDSGHPHIHIITVKVRADGTRIDMQNIGRNQSENARKEIEQSFGLVKAERGKQMEAYRLKPVNVQKVQYGKTETKRAISNVLNTVIENYRYTSLPELNAILQQYNIVADRGSEDSRIYQNNGLVYRILDAQGYKVGVPIKASDFYNKPTLKFLEGQFHSNDAARQPYKNRVKNVIDLAFLKSQNVSLSELTKSLDKEGISVVLRQNASGIIYGITYVDHQTKCVFNGSVLGKQYSARALQERCTQDAYLPGKATSQSAHEQSQVTGRDPMYSPYPQADVHPPAFNSQIATPEVSKSSGNTGGLDALLQPEYSPDYIPNQLKKKGKKKKKKRISRNI